MSSTPPPPEPYDPPPAGRADAAAPGYSAPPAYQPPAGTPVKKSNRLGLIAFIVALAGVVIGSILAFVGGMQSGALAEFATTAGGTTEIDPSTLSAEQQASAAGAGFLTLAAFLVFAALGLWGFIQGIVAAVKNRGRGLGIAAIVLAVLGGIAVFIFYVVGLSAGAAPYLENLG